jgi:chromosomal replication initiation ATPase DnaA
MNQLATIEASPTVMAAGREIKIVTSFDEATAERYRRAAKTYTALCEANPGENRARIALAAGAQAFEIPVIKVRAHERTGDLPEMRQQLMAFARVVSYGEPVLNSYNNIGRVFHRKHATVIYAVKKYGDAIADLLEKHHAT